MHAYNRTEADQTDSIAVCATKEEWSSVIDELLRGGWEPNEPSSSLVHWLINQGVYE